MSLYELRFASPVVSLLARLWRDSPFGEANFINGNIRGFSFERIAMVL